MVSIRNRRKIESHDRGDLNLQSLRSVERGTMSFGNRPGQVNFIDVANSAGISRQGQTWGLTLYDFTGNGQFGLYQNNHQSKPVSIFETFGNGQYIDLAPQLLPQGAPGDFHGAIGVDIDNDGVQELFQVSGGDLGASDDNQNKNNRLFFREGNRLVDRAGEYGIEYPLGRGRMPLAFDFNDDGDIDLLETAPSRPDGRSIPTIFLNSENGFTDIGRNSGLDINTPNGAFAVLGDLNGDDRQELLYLAKRPKLKVYDTSRLPLRDITSSLIPNNLLNGVTNIKDIAIGDFNGDSFQDIFIIQQGTSTSGYRLESDRKGRAKLKLQRDVKGLTFRNAGDLSLNFQGDPSLQQPVFFQTPTISRTEIFLGAGRRNPSGLVFNLDSSNPIYRGRPNFRAGVDRGVFIWFDVARNSWTVEASSNRGDDINFLFETESKPVIGAQNFNVNLKGKPDVLLTYDPQLGRYINGTAAAGLNDTRIAGRNVVSGDFDNDADLDLYIVATANTQNLPNVLLENLGNGRFRQVSSAAGAAGTNKGIGDSVAVGDYDIDGDLDFFVTNGDALGFDRPFALDGSNQLFQNQGNGNHSIQIDLQGNGIDTNRDAIGAKVYVTTPDGKRQVREQNGGVHNRVQNASRIHFGLGDQETISLLEVVWPNGDRQTFRNVVSDRVIRLVQGQQSVTTRFNYDPIPPDFSVTGTQGDDTLRGTGDADTLQGVGGDDILRGLQDDDRLVGGNGRDTLIGGPGEDTLVGGSGADEFQYVTRKQGGDVITDFASGVDQLTIRAKGFKAGLTPGVLPNNRISYGAIARDAGDRFIYDSTQGRLLFDSDGTGRQRPTLLAQFQGRPVIRASDIVVF